MSKTTAEQAIAYAKKHDLRLNGYGCHDKLAALIDEVRGVDAEPVAQHVAIIDGGEISRELQWNKDIAAFDFPVGTKLYTHK